MVPRQPGKRRFPIFFFNSRTRRIQGVAERVERGDEAAGF